MPETTTRDAILQAVREDGHCRVKVAATDVDGVLRGKTMHKEKFLSAAAKGFGFCDVVFGWDVEDACYDNGRFTGWHTGYPDAQARVDLATFRRVPWDHNVAFFLADFVDEHGKPLAVCPRQTLRRVVQRAASRGYDARFGLEFEWFNFRETPQSLAQKGYQAPEPLEPGMFGYSMLRAGLERDYVTTILEQLDHFDVAIEGLHTETGPGVYEAAILVDRALPSADRGVLFKSSVKEIAYGFGIIPSFMAKPEQSLPGCSGHLHQSLWSLEAEARNLFHDEARPHRMTPLFESYVAGQLALLPDLGALYAPTVNSYKRLVEGHWAPTRVTWGVDNRTVALRVIPGRAASTRLETRLPGADANPYLAIAAALGSGLYGIEKKLRLATPPVSGNAYEADAVELPRTLQEATARLAASEAAKEILGADTVDHFVRTREWEWRRFREAVTDWERRRYLEII